MLRYAEEVQEMHILVLGAPMMSESVLKIGDRVFVYATKSASKIRALIEGMKIGMKIANEHAIDVITTQDPFETALIGYMVKRRTHAALNIQEHGDFFYQPYWRSERMLHMIRYFVGLWLMRRADCWRVVSERQKNKLSAHGFPEDKILVVPVHTEVSRLEDGVTDQEIETLRPAGGLVLLTMARLVRQKNLEMLIRAFMRVYRRYANTRLVIVGRGPEEQRLKAAAHEMTQTPSHGQPPIVFLDWTDDPAAAMQSADIYILSSYYEGWGRVCIEALAAGTPLVMTDVGCAGEVVEHEVNGLISPVGDEAALAANLERLIENRELREQLMRGGMRTVEHLPTKEQNTALYLRTLTQCHANK